MEYKHGVYAELTDSKVKYGSSGGKGQPSVSNTQAKLGSAKLGSDKLG